MGRAHRLTVEGGIFHVTHRCHNQAFLLKFVRDRDAYREKLREIMEVETQGVNVLREAAISYGQKGAPKTRLRPSQRAESRVASSHSLTYAGDTRMPA